MKAFLHDLYYDIPKEEYNINAIATILTRIRAGYDKHKLPLLAYKKENGILDTFLEQAEIRYLKYRHTEDPNDLIDCIHYLIRELNTKIEE